MIREYHGILVGLEAVPSDETAKKLAALNDMTSNKIKQYNNYKINTRAYADLQQCCTQEKCNNIKIDTANGSTSSVTHIGNVLCADGETKKNVMKNVKVVPGLVKNLFLLSTVMRNDWDLMTETRNNIKILKIKKGNIEYEFDRKVSKNANGGYLMGMQIEPTKIEETKKRKMMKKHKN